MIGRLRGTLVHKQPPWLIVDVGGVGYELEAPMSTVYDLPELGREVVLFVHHAQKEDSVSLYGFLREGERRLFRDVQKVTGIGAKIALAILSGSSVEDFARQVQGGDTAAISRIPGIGKKTAERIVLELGDKVGVKDAWKAQSVASGLTPEAAAKNDALLALISLGYKQVEAQKAIGKIPGDLVRPDEMLRAALRLLQG